MENKKSHEPTLDELDELLNGEANYNNVSNCAHILRNEITDLKNKADTRLMHNGETTGLVDTINEINKLLAVVIKMGIKALYSRNQINNNEYYVEFMVHLKTGHKLLKALKEKYELIERSHNDVTKENTNDGFDFDEK